MMNHNQVRDDDDDEENHFHDKRRLNDGSLKKIFLRKFFKSNKTNLLDY